MSEYLSVRSAFHLIRRTDTRAWSNIGNDYAYVRTQQASLGLVALISPFFFSFSLDALTHILSHVIDKRRVCFVLDTPCIHGRLKTVVSMATPSLSTPAVRMHSWLEMDGSMDGARRQHLLLLAVPIHISGAS